jgi:hypothetical protein
MPSIYDRLTQPLTDLPSRIGKKVSKSIGPDPSSSNVPISMVRSVLGDTAEGVGNQLSDMTSPLSLVMAGLGLGGAKNLLSVINKTKKLPISPTLMTPKPSIYSVPDLPSAVPLNNKMLLQDQAARIAKVTDPMKARELEAELSFMNRRAGLPSSELGKLPVGPSKRY